MLKWFMNIKIAAKLVLGFTIVSLIAGMVGVVGLINLNQIEKAGTLLYEENVLGLEYAGNAAVYYQRIRFNAVKSIMVDVAADRDSAIQNIADYIVKSEEYLKSYKDRISSETDQNQFDALIIQWDQYKELITQTISYIQTGDLEQAKILILGDVATVGTLLQDSFDQMFAYNSTSGQARSAQNSKLASTATIIMIVVVILGILFAIVLGLYISRLISKPINKMVRAAGMLAKGDLNVDININTTEEIGTLASAFEKLANSTREQARIAQCIAEGDLTVSVAIRSENDVLGRSIADLLEKLNQIVEAIVAAADQVASGSNMVSNSSMALSQGATEQASSIEELTASLEEISSQTNQNARNASNANELVREAEIHAVSGNTQMNEMLEAMDEINESSSNINKIIKVIDDIAFQTNILALNAAVEAARAGQHGKGFAVVAEEVRTLAARSANAVKETTEMIEGSIHKVEAGTKIANNTADALNKIVDQVKRAAELVGDIAGASKEQALGVEQTNQGIMQISQVVQTNAATSEEAAAASEELSTQAVQLKELVSIFKLKESKSYTKTADKTVPKSLEKNKTPALPAARAKISLAEENYGKY